MITTFEKITEVDAPPEKIFALLIDFESYPRWMQNITGVRRTAEDSLEWHRISRRGGGASENRWSTHLVVNELDRRLAWRSVGSDAAAASCEISLQETERNTTLVSMMRDYESDGAHQDSAARAEHREQMLEEDLARFKQFAETSVTAPHDIPHDSDHKYINELFRRGVDRLLDGKAALRR